MRVRPWSPGSDGAAAEPERIHRSRAPSDGVAFPRRAVAVAHDRGQSLDAKPCQLERLLESPALNTNHSLPSRRASMRPTGDGINDSGQLTVSRRSSWPRPADRSRARRRPLAVRARRPRTRPSSRCRGNGRPRVTPPRASHDAAGRRSHDPGVTMPGPSSMTCHHSSSATRLLASANRSGVDDTAP